MTAFAAITSERNETSRRAKAKKSTKANTSGAEVFMAERPSMSIAVPPVTPYST